ncbi:MAG: hypothetical protein METHP_01078 [Methanoregula sp. SKADARSKE-2]|nr:MAG: hypothetical protein METHP_01078 [Methanoregula sp. SKADARSKE-2]
MDKTGIIAFVVGLLLCVLGAYAMLAFLPEVINAVKGLIGIVILIFGLMAVVFGILIIRD